jgi:hypothetical protein
MGCEMEPEHLDPWYEEPSTDQDGVVSLLRSRHGPRSA